MLKKKGLRSIIILISLIVLLVSCYVGYNQYGIGMNTKSKQKKILEQLNSNNYDKAKELVNNYFKNDKVNYCNFMSKLDMIIEGNDITDEEKSDLINNVNITEINLDDTKSKESDYIMVRLRNGSKREVSSIIFNVELIKKDGSTEHKQMCRSALMYDDEAEFGEYLDNNDYKDIVITINRLYSYDYH